MGKEADNDLSSHNSDGSCVQRESLKQDSRKLKVCEGPVVGRAMPPVTPVLGAQTYPGGYDNNVSIVMYFTTLHVGHITVVNRMRTMKPSSQSRHGD